MKKVLVVPLAAAVMVAGCGGKSTHTTSGRTTSSTTTSARSTGSVPDCDSAGINPSQMREGTCTHAGITYVIVDENHTLRLQTLWGKLDTIRVAKSVTNAASSATAQGEFVIASVRLTNKLGAPQAFDQAQTQQAGLILDGGLYKEAVSAESTADPSSCLVRGRTAIKPGASITCDVIFDVPASSAATLGQHGSADLYLADFGSNLAGSILPQTVGQIRLYH